MAEEARLPRLGVEEIAAELRPMYDAFIAQRGKVPNLFRVAAHQPRVARTLAAHLDAVMGPGTTPQLLKELLSVRVSRINDCEY